MALTNIELYQHIIISMKNSGYPENPICCASEN